MKRFFTALALVVVLLGSSLVVRSPETVGVAAAAAPEGAITWTVDHNRKRIDVLVRLQIYTGCSGNPYGEPNERASSCTAPHSMVGGPTQFLADKIKRQIERIWNKPYKYRCYELHFLVDIKLGTDGAHIDIDRLGVRIDPTPTSIRSYVHAGRNQIDRWQSDDPGDRVVPENGGANATTWAEAPSSFYTYAHEFGHLLGLHDAYIDVPDESHPGEITSVPIPGAPLDIMSTSNTSTIAQETIDRLVKRNLPDMRDTNGKPVTDADLVCDWQGVFAGKHVTGTLRWCGITPHPYWGLAVVLSDGTPGYVSYLIPQGSDETVQGEIDQSLGPHWDPSITGTGAFIPGDPAHFLLDIGDGTYLIPLTKGNFCAPAH